MVVGIASGPPAAIYVDHDEASKVAPEVATVVQGLAAELMQHTSAIAAEITRRAVEAEPGLADPDDPTSLVAADHSTEANVGAILSTLAYGVPADAIRPPLGALELFEHMAEREDGLKVVLRGYRLGIRELWQIWAAFVASRTDDPALLHAILAASTSHMHTYVDRISEQLTADWHELRRRHRQGLAVSVDKVVRRVLFGCDHDGAGLAKIDYPVEATHVAAALPPELEEREVDALARRLRDCADAKVMAARVGDGTTIWVAFSSSPSQRQLDAVERVLGGGDSVGLSEPASGPNGVRTAFREAADARRIGTLRRSAGVTRYRDVALLAVLCADPERARALAHAELGPLAVDEEPMSRVRETVATYLECGESHVAAAQRLFVHQKTVAYRVRQAEGLLGHRLSERRAELEAALLVHRALGAMA